MHNYSVTMRNVIIFLGCFLLFLWGCDKQSVEKENKKVVSKKIVVAEKKMPETGPEKKEPEKNENVPVEPATEGPAETTQPVAKQPDATQKDIEEKSDRPIVTSVAITKKMDDTVYVYDPTGKIDPFAPIFKEQTGTTEIQPKNEKKPRRIPLTPLEQISLSQLKLVAVMLAPSGDKALVEEVSGKGYIIKEGTFIGMNSGRVDDILIDKVVVTEEVEDILGNITIRKTEMKLQKAAGE